MVQAVDAVSQLGEVVNNVRAVFDNVRPSSSTHFGLLDGSTAGYLGFAADFRPGLAMVSGNVASAEPDNWFLQMNSAVGYEAVASMDALNWVNSRNRNSLAGKYYLNLTPDGSLCAVAWEAHLWCRLVDGSMFEQQSQVQLRSLIQLVEYCHHVASQEAAEFRQQFGGRALTTSEQDMTNLYTMTN